MSGEDLGYRPGRWVRLRMYGSVALVGMLFALLGYRAWVLQVRESGRLKGMAEDQYLRDVELPPRRGRILDRHGAELAASAEVDSVYANPRLIGARAGEVARLLAGPLGMDRRELEKKLKVRRYFAWLKRRVDPEVARAVRELELSGVSLTKEPRRWYPHRALGGPLLGWAGLDAVGQEGLELQFNRWLRGQPAAVPGLRDALGRAVLVGGLGDAAPQIGHDVHTTIDRYLQFRLERALAKGVSANRAKAGVAVALDPRNGEVLAMASVPSLNPNEPEQARGKGVRLRAVTDPFEPGSTMKSFSIAGAIDAGLVRPDESWFCENGRFKVGPATIHDTHPIGAATTTEVLARSSNVCTAKIAARQGRQRLYDALSRFGFGRPTGVDLPGERAGLLRAAARMGPVETATIAFGQGMTATPLQLAAGYAAIANGGIWHRPHLMRRIVDANGATVKEAKQEGRRVVSPETAEAMRRMLVAVSQPGGTAERLSLPGYDFGGKTGTAQKVDPVTRHYSTDKWASSFVGFAPAADPRLVLFVMIDEPEGGTHYGSMVAGPVFQETMIDALPWLGISPTVAVATPTTEQGRTRSGSRETAAATVPPQGLRGGASAVGDLGKEAAPAEAPTHELAALAAVDATQAEVPDFSGMSLAEALQAARRAGLRLEVQGSGYASTQSPGPGKVQRGAACRVSFVPSG